jgi:hypothetical protein
VLREGAMTAMRFVSWRRIERDFSFVCHDVPDTVLVSEPTNRLANGPQKSIQMQDG